MRIKKIKDFGLGLFVCLFSLILCFLIIPSQVHVPKAFERGVSAQSPAFFPTVISVSMFLLGCVIIAHSLARKEAIGDENFLEHRFTRQGILIIFSLLIYFVLLGTVGFYIGSGLILVLLVWFFGERRWRLTFFVIGFFLLGIYFFFEKTMDVMLIGPSLF